MQDSVDAKGLVAQTPGDDCDRCDDSVVGPPASPPQPSPSIGLLTHRQSGPQSAGGPTRRPRKTAVTRTACQQCRRSKVKCDGKHPVCLRCYKNATKCEYDVPSEGMTRMQYLQQEIAEKSQRFDGLMSLVHYFRHRTDHEAAVLLTRLRMGEPLDSLVAGLAEADESFALHQGDDVWRLTAQYPAGFSPDGYSDSAVSPYFLSSPTFPPPSIYRSNSDSCLTELPEIRYANFSAALGEFVDTDEAVELRAEVARLTTGRIGRPQVAFGGIEWPAPP